jgi:hypothetical protein
MISEDSAVKLIAQVGFPITVALWFMFRTEKVIDNNTKAMGEVKQVLTTCQKK